MSSNARPGVYTSYEVTGNIYGGRGGSAVGLAAKAQGGEAGSVVELSRGAQAAENFSGGDLLRLAELLLRNGAPKVYAVRVEGEDYASAFERLMEKGEIKFMVCDSRSDSVHAAMKEAIMGGDEQGKYRIGVVESDDGTASALISAARALACERMLLCSHHESEGTPGAVAAAVCGLMASSDDPALPLNGAELLGLEAIGSNYSDSAVAELIAGGVSPIESVGGVKSIVRGVTTRSLSGGAPDSTWRDVNTVMILDRVLPEIRDGLRARFSRAKNNAQTRGAIRSQVLVALEDYLSREMIDSYGDIVVEQSEADAGICAVSFAFTVAHGLNKIELFAQISV